MTKRNLHILMLEDDPLDAELNKEQLIILDEYNCIVKLVTKKEEYLNALFDSTPDIVLCDYNVPGYNGLEALKDLKKVDNLIPFIFVTGTMKEEIAVDAIKSGAWDYVVKDRLFRLPLAINSVLKIKSEKEIAQKAEEQNHKLLMAIEQTSAQIIVTDLNGNIEYVNKKFTEITGFQQDEVIGKDAAILGNYKHLKDISKDNKSLKNGEVINGEILEKTHDGTEIWELISITPIRNSDNKITNFVAVKEDITYRKKMEQELIEAKNNAERSSKLKEAFLQNMSHEIRTPLNAIVGFSELLSTGSNLSLESIYHYTSTIENSSRQLLNIVTDILTISSIQTGQEIIRKSPVDILSVIDEVFQYYYPFAKEKNLEYTYSKNQSDSTLILNTDEKKIYTILSNLINNSIKFTHKGSVKVSYNITNNEISILIEDTGIGISKKNHKLIFESFRQADKFSHVEYGGTGLGLTISDAFAKMLGGSIEVESDVDKGSKFRLLLPLDKIEKRDPEEQKNKYSDNEDEDEDEIITILIAEDELNNYLLLESILSGSRTSLIHAHNGAEAVEICKNNSKIDIVLMDIKMPVMDGVTAFYEIKKIRPNLPIIAQTAYAMEIDEKKFLQIGFNNYVAKPIKISELLKTINKVMMEFYL